MLRHGREVACSVCMGEYEAGELLRLLKNLAAIIGACTAGRLVTRAELRGLFKTI